MKIRKIFFTIFIVVFTTLLALIIYDFLIDTENLINVTTNNNIMTDNQVSIRDVKNATSTISNNITDSTNHTDFKDPATIALLSITSVLVLVVLCGTGYLIYNYLQLPLEAQQNLDTIELQNM